MNERFAVAVHEFCAASNLDNLTDFPRQTDRLKNTHDFIVECDSARLVIGRNRKIERNCQYSQLPQQICQRSANRAEADDSGADRADARPEKEST